MNKSEIIEDAELRMNGIDILNKNLGPSAALRFLSLLHHDATDYIEISKRIYKDQSVDDVFDRAKKQWS